MQLKRALPAPMACLSRGVKAPAAALEKMMLHVAAKRREGMAMVIKFFETKLVKINKMVPDSIMMIPLEAISPFRGHLITR
jgi:hypothetical protein